MEMEKKLSGKLIERKGNYDIVGIFINIKTLLMSKVQRTIKMFLS